MDKIRNLYVSEVCSDDKLYVLKKMGVSAKLTQFAKFIGHFSSVYDCDYFLDGENYNNFDSDTFGIRPVVKYSDIKEFITNSYVNNKGVMEIEFGNFPTDEVTGIKAIALNYSFFNRLSSIKFLEDFNISLNTNTIFDDEKPYASYTKFDFNGNKYLACYEKEDKKVHYFKYMPVKWIVDEKQNLAICKNIILSNIPYCVVDFNCSNEFNGDIISDYLNNSFLTELEPKVLAKMKSIN